MKVTVKFQSFQMKAVMAIYDNSIYGGDQYPFTFGVKKAEMLLAALEQDPDILKRFVNGDYEVQEEGRA